MTVRQAFALLVVAAVTAAAVSAVFNATQLWKPIRSMGRTFGVVSVDDLSSEDPDTVRSALHHLRERRDPSGQKRARALLESDDDYIWLNAAIYLASLGDATTVPWLIKSLRHPASRSVDERVATLERLTGESLGNDQDAWINWWKETNPGSAFEFRYLNYQREAERLPDRNMLLVNGVLDAVTIRHGGLTIRLIGVRPVNGTDDPNAIAFLKSLVVSQYVQLRFDGGRRLDAEGSRRALVYWCMELKDSWNPLRRGLSSIPFKELPGPNPLLLPYEQKPLIQLHLIESGLYEAAPEEVEDEELRRLLRETSDE